MMAPFFLVYDRPVHFLTIKRPESIPLYAMLILLLTDYPSGTLTEPRSGPVDLWGLALVYISVLLLLPF